MGMRRYIALYGSVLFMVMIMCIPQTASAYYDSGTRTLDAETWLFFDLTYERSGNLEYTVSTGSYDPNIDAFLVTSAEYYKFKRGDDFDYYSSCSDFDTSSANINCRVSSAGSYYLVFDNSYYGVAYPYEDESATITYTVSAVEDSAPPNGNGGDDLWFTSIICLGIGGLIFILIIVAVIAAVMKRKKRRAATPPPTTARTYQAPAQTYSQPAQTYTQPTQPYSQPQTQPTRHHAHTHAQPPPGTHVPMGATHRQHQPPPVTTPPPQPTPTYSGPPAPPAQPSRFEAEKKEGPPELILPGMIGGTKGTLDDTYSKAPEPKRPK